MDDAGFALLDSRAAIGIGGPDREAFLQGLISNDIRKASDERAIWSALLNPQGKYQFDFFIVGQGDRLLLDVETDRRAALLKRLKIFKLRAQVTFEDLNDAFEVAVAFGGGASGALGLGGAPGDAKAFNDGAVYVDPRLEAAGARAILPRGRAAAALEAIGLAASDLTAYDRIRTSLGLPDGARDMEVDKAILLENGFDELGGCDWNKGCYMGQELTARTKYRGLIKKRLMPVKIEGAPPPPGTPVMSGDKQAGEMRSGAGSVGLALLRLDKIADGDAPPLTAGNAVLHPKKPDWAMF